MTSEGEAAERPPVEFTDPTTEAATVATIESQDELITSEHPENSAPTEPTLGHRNAIKNIALSQRKVRRKGDQLDLVEAAYARLRRLAGPALGSAAVYGALSYQGQSDIISFGGMAMAGVAGAGAYAKTRAQESVNAPFGARVQVHRDRERSTGRKPSEQKVLTEFIPPTHPPGDRPTVDFMRWQLSEFKKVLPESDDPQERILLPERFLRALTKEGQDHAQRLTGKEAFTAGARTRRYKSNRDNEHFILVEASVLNLIDTETKDSQDMLGAVLERLATLNPNTRLATIFHSDAYHTESDQQLLKNRLEIILKAHFFQEATPSTKRIIENSSDDNPIETRQRFGPTISVEETDGGLTILEKLLATNEVIDSGLVSTLLEIDDYVHAAENILLGDPSKDDEVILAYVAYQLIGQHLLIPGDDLADVDRQQDIHTEYAARSKQFRRKPSPKLNITTTKPERRRDRTIVGGATLASVIAVGGLSYTAGDPNIRESISLFWSDLPELELPGVESSGGESSGGSSISPNLPSSVNSPIDRFLRPSVESPDSRSPIWRLEDRGIGTEGYYGHTAYEAFHSGTWNDQSSSLDDFRPFQVPVYDDGFSQPHVKVDGRLLLRDSDATFKIPIRDDTQLGAITAFSGDSPVAFMTERASDNTIRVRVFSEDQTIPVNIEYALVAAEDQSQALRAVHDPLLSSVNSESTVDITQWSSRQSTRFNEDGIDLEYTADLIKNGFVYNLGNAALEADLERQNHPDEFIEAVAHHGECDCDVCNSAFALLATTVDDGVSRTLASGYINFSGHNGSGGTTDFLTTDEAHAWTVDNSGNITDVTPVNAAGTFGGVEPGYDNEDIALEWLRRDSRFDDFNQNRAELERQAELARVARNFMLVQGGLFAAYVTFNLAGHSIHQGRRRFLESAGPHDAYRVLTDLVWSPDQTVRVHAERQPQTRDGVDYVSLANNHLKGDRLDHFVRRPDAHMTGDPSLISEARAMAHHARKSRRYGP